MAEKSAKKQEHGEGRSLATWRPFGEFEHWPWDMLSPIRTSRLLDEFFRSDPASRAGGFVPSVDVSEADDRYKVTVEVPGTDKDDLHVELREGMLTIRGEKKSEREETKERTRYVERRYGSFSRSFTLPPDADGEHLVASFQNGVLTITIPRREEAKPRTIAIKS